MVVREVIVDQLFELFGGLAVSLVVDALAALLLTAWRWFSRFSGVMARPRMRSASGTGRGRADSWAGFIVGSAVGVGGAVGVAAVGVDEEIELADAYVFRAFEHHVLEEVGEAGAARALVLRPHFVGDAMA